jgi:hypothetical protein
LSLISKNFPSIPNEMAYRVDTAESGDAIAAVFKAAPGTEILYDAENEHGATSQHLHKLQHVRHGDGHILLVPQPSLTDPNDPLRWSLVKKWVVLMNGVWYAFNGAVTGPIMAAGISSSTPHACLTVLIFTLQEWSRSLCDSTSHYKN